MQEFIHSFMECNGTPKQHTSAECMDYLQNILGYSFEVARGVLGLAVARGYIIVTSEKNAPVKTYNQLLTAIYAGTFSTAMKIQEIKENIISGAQAEMGNICPLDAN